MLNNIKAAIFDMDGTLIDSMWIWDKIDIDYLNKRNLSIPKDLRENIDHLSFEEVALYFKKKFNIDDSLEEIKTEWFNMAIQEYTHNITLKPGAKDFLEYLKSMHIKIGLATSNCIPLIEAGLKSTDIYNYFDSITTTNEVSRGKDFPDVYLLAAEKLGVNPLECIVFEDILPAVKGAKAASMKVIGIYDNFSEHQRQTITEVADKYICDYTELINVI